MTEDSIGRKLCSCTSLSAYCKKRQMKHGRCRYLRLQNLSCVCTAVGECSDDTTSGVVFERNCLFSGGPTGRKLCSCTFLSNYCNKRHAKRGRCHKIAAQNVRSFCPFFSSFRAPQLKKSPMPTHRLVNIVGKSFGDI